jgi:hypothetical protein
LRDAPDAAAAAPSGTCANIAHLLYLRLRLYRG